MGVEENSNGEFSDDQLLGEDAAQRENLKDYGLFGPMQLARAHWIQLHKTNMQAIHPAVSPHNLHLISCPF